MNNRLTAKLLFFMCVSICFCCSMCFAEITGLLPSFSDPYVRVTSNVFYDAFDGSMSVDQYYWTTITGTVQANADAANEPSAPYSVNLEGTEAIQSHIIDLSSAASAKLNYCWERGKGLLSGDMLYVEYWNGSSWQSLQSHAYNQGSATQFTSASITLPAGCLISEFQVRFRAACGSASREWFVDNIEVKIPESNSEPHITNQEITTVRLEYQAAGVTLTNYSEANIACDVSITGLDPSEFTLEVRKQVFINSWYKPTDWSLADPLPLLPLANGKWQITVPANSREKLYISIYAKDAVAGGTKSASVTLESAAQSEALSLQINVLPVTFPSKNIFTHHAWTECVSNICKTSTRTIAATDLQAHRVNMMMIAYMPTVYFNSDGTIHIMGNIDAIIDYYKDYVHRYWLLWPVNNTFSIYGGGTLTKFTAEWDNALKNLLTAFLDRMATRGYPVERFVLAPLDEPHSDSFTITPPSELGQDITDFIHISTVAKSANQNLAVGTTLTDYAGPADVEALLPYLDVVLPHWPYRTCTLSGQPAGYIPRDAYYSIILPMLEEWRNNSGGEIFGYHVARGKSDDILFSTRCYPIIAFAEKATGMSVYSHNYARGLTWNSIDGGGLDYGWVYDGDEEDDANHAVNPDHEQKIIPSIRYEASRAGIQDATILQHLKNRRSACNTVMQDAIDNAISQAEDIAEEVRGIEYISRLAIHTYTGFVNADYVANFSKNLRQLYYDVGSITFQQGVNGYTGTDDNHVYNGSNAAKNCGASTVMLIGISNGSERRAFIRFDVSSLAGQYSAIRSARLELTGSITSNAITLHLFQITDLNAGWVEGNGNFTTATAGESCWLYKAYNTINWTGSYGMYTAGTDYITAPLDSITCNTSDPVGKVYSFNLTPQLIEQWVTGTNAGLLLMRSDLSYDGQKQFYTSNYATDPTKAPRLIVEYTP